MTHTTAARSLFASALITAFGTPSCEEASCAETRTCAKSFRPDGGAGGESGSRAETVEAGAAGAGLAVPGTGGSPTMAGGTAGTVPEQPSVGGADLGGEGGGVGAGVAGESNAGSGGTDAEAEPEGPCDPNPCAHGACSPIGAAYECACDDGYSGPLCETNIDDCTPNPCENGGRCEDGVASYECVCAQEFTGEDCHLLRFELLGELEGDDRSAAEMMSADARVVVGTSSTATTQRLFRWRDGVMEDIGKLPDHDWCAPWGMVPDASVIVGYCRESASLAFRWENGTMTPLPPLPGHTASQAFHVTADGVTVVGTSSTNAETSQVKWVNGVPAELGVPADARVLGISGDGSTLLAERGDEDRPVLIRQGEETPLPPASGSESCEAETLGSNGSVVLGFCNIGGLRQPTVWRNLVPEVLSPPPEKLVDQPNFEFGRASWGATAAVAWAFSTSGTANLIWDEEHGLRWFDLFLDESGIELPKDDASPTAISDDLRTVVGSIGYSVSQPHAFIGRLP